ncbi:hypothetical protein tinsulaeT_15390 [Thalassotalea insulae]|uniref:Uncharacterized protein n=1 Tax=Thalassotalea insulae TaxID=2056778 RepID=A0ABQ6GS92_9GAMM|nr:hypothetical protein [Thalassotalea insulae]GLX78199.1 hypothetical protein tinsulaeT_15390 [Thalassotalea insulae]
MLLTLLVLIITISLALVLIIRKKHMHLWLGHYLKRKLFLSSNTDGTKHIMFCFVDHYEPMWGKDVSYQQECDRVERWHQDYPKVAKQFKDADGCYPKHSFFYPEEEYRREHLDKITDLCAQGMGEIEIHLHHHNDTSENLRNTLERFTETLHENHGAFVRDEQSGKLQYTFIHGNWCLDNSLPSGNMCGVNDELIVLKETGCYADFTFPSAPSPTQPAMVNEIYYAKDDPEKPKSHNTGKVVTVGGNPWGDLMLITGPVGLNWKQCKKGFIPQIENSDIRTSMPPTKDRVDLWVDTAITVKGKPDWLFIKVHTHGTQEQDMDTLLGQPFYDMCQYLEEKYNDGEDYALHYVSAREMYNIVKAAEAGQQGNPNDYRDYVVAAPNYKAS